MAARFKSPAIAELVEQLKVRLPDYLRQLGILDGDVGTRFLCLNPDHDDHTPSMVLNPHVGYTKAKCFVCGASYDIFKVASIKAGKPEKGPGWVYQNVYYLAKELNVPFQEIQPTDEEIRYMQIAGMYDDASEILSESANSIAATTTYCVERGLTKETCVAFGVASIPYDLFVKEMAARGHNQEVCKEMGLDDEMFGDGRVTFTLKDANGFVVGFARKYLAHDKAQHKLAKNQQRYYPPKYVNTSSKVPFYDKSSFLYGLHYAKAPASGRIDLFEGYFDFLFAQQAGITNCASVCGTSLTGSQVDLIRSVGFRHVNIVFDSEPEGEKAATKMLNVFSGYEGLRVTVMFLKFPEDVDPKDRDPDEYIKRYGAEAYQKVEPVSAFSWRLASLVAEGVEGLALCETMLPQILNESSRIVRSELMLNLSNASGIAIEVIKDEIDRLTDKDVASLSAQVIADLNRAKDSKRRAEIIRKAVGDLNEVVGKAEDVADFTWEESHRAFLSSCEHNETANLGIGGWKTGWTKFDESFDGLPKEGQILGIAGAPNCGKSAWLTSLINNLLLNNEAGLSVIFHVLDDPRNVAYAKLLSALTAIPIGHIIRANKYISPYPDILYSYNQAKDWLQNQMKTGRLVVKGQELGNDTEIAENLIDSVAAKTGNKIVYIGDSFHSLDDKSTTEERIRYKRVAEWTMRITETRRMTMVFTVELTKIGMDGRPRLYMLAESGKLMYAMKAVGLVYNELHDKRQQAGTYWVDGQDDGIVNQQIKRPILEIEWAKNKISEFKGSQYMRFHDHLALLEEMSKEEFAKAREESQKTLAEIPRQAGASMLTIDSMAPVRGNFVLAGKTNG